MTNDSDDRGRAAIKAARPLFVTTEEVFQSSATGPVEIVDPGDGWWINQAGNAGLVDDIGGESAGGRGEGDDEDE